MTKIPFIKMHGLGNDFVVIDSRVRDFSLNTRLVSFICNRHRGVGCDQLVVLSASEKADCMVRFYNQDGSESSACGNASRCVAHLIMAEKSLKECLLQTHDSLLHCAFSELNMVQVNMGRAKTDWIDIPMSSKVDTLHVDISSGPLNDGVGVSMGNPHVVFFVDDIDDIDMQAFASPLEHHPLFPERVNVGVAQIVCKTSIKLRVWERGSGETLACGSGACAAAVAGMRRKLTESLVTVQLPGGDLYIDIQSNGDLLMKGPVAISFTGVLDTEVVE